MPNEGQRTVSFEVPVGSGDFAPEILYLRSREQLTDPVTFSEAHDGGVSEYQVVIEALTAGAQLEVDLLNAGSDPAVEANWNNDRVFSTVGTNLVESLTRQAVRVRAKSGGTAGTTTASVTWAGPSAGRPSPSSRIARGLGSVEVNEDGTVSIVGDTDITGTLGVTDTATFLGDIVSNNGAQNTVTIENLPGGSGTGGGIINVRDHLGTSIVSLDGRVGRTGILLSTNAIMTGPLDVTGGVFNLGTNLSLVRDADDVLAQRRGTNPQTVRIYGTFTDASNYERLEILTQAGNTIIQQTQAGTGSVRPLQLGTVGNASLVFFTNGIFRWLIDSIGNLTTIADNAYDIGVAGANRPRDLFLARNALIGGDARVSGGLASGALSNIKAVDTELTALTGASVIATGLIPAGSFIIGVTVRVTTEITGATTFDIGDGIDVDRWGAAIVLPAGTTTDITDFTGAGFGQFASANDVVLTANVANFTAGAVRITVHYLDLTPPTS